MRKFLSVVLMLAIVGCTPVQPTPVPSPPAPTVICNNSGTNNVCNVGNVTAPSPAPSGQPTGPFPKPDYVKITQFGENCPTGVEPSGIDRSVRIGCTKALTLSPKCRMTTGPDVDCPVPENAAPDEFKCSTGCDHISFSAFGSVALSAQAVKSFSGPHMKSDAFNRLATGKTEGQAVITGSYAGIRVQEDFTLTVIK